MQKQKSHNLPKFIMTMTVILFLGTLFGVVSYYLMRDNKVADNIKEIKQINKETFSCGTSTVEDIDNNIYNTVKIGEQCWLKENLKVTKNPEGEKITRYCYDNKKSICETDGGLYNWETAMNNSTEEGAQGICPDGWHVPRDSEWFVLESGLSTGSCSGTRDGRSDTWDCDPAGIKLIKDGSSGFEGYFVGNRNTNGSFGGRGTDTVFWSSTDLESIALNRVLNITRSKVHRTTGLKAYGHSIRCLRD